MKILIVVRHAKSSWKYDVSDIDRPLKSVGITDAALVSNKFKMGDYKPETIFSSPAKRAFETCKIFIANMGYSNKNIQISDQLYDFGGNKVVNFIKSLDKNHKSIMIFGHNHALTAIVNTYGDINIDNLPTSGLVIIKFEIDSWKDIENGKTELILFPRHLK
ncbi:MAG: histidine phosphatase family protein [Flavobacteriaceae bacterium]|nr:histidine phosphatase family protein [Flavobacteriaceae bacterium]